MNYDNDGSHAPTVVIKYNKGCVLAGTGGLYRKCSVNHKTKAFSKEIKCERYYVESKLCRVGCRVEKKGGGWGDYAELPVPAESQLLLYSVTAVTEYN